MGKRIHTALFNTILLSVYTVFFSVQFLFNFDGPEPGNSGNIFHYSSSLLHPGRKVTYGKNSSSHHSSHTIRLNKRFHQENITPCQAASVDAPPQYAVRKAPKEYRDPLLPSFIPVHRLLRGPPVVA